MNIRSAKQKGKRLAKKARELFLAYSPLEPDDIAVTPSSVPGPDVTFSPRAKQFFPFATECKNTEKLQAWEAIEQAKSHVKNGEFPLVIFSRNRCEPYAIIALKDLLEWKRVQK